MNFIPAKLATHALLIFFSLALVFHSLVLAGIIPFEIVWGGRLKSKEEMIPFEIASILLNMAMLAVVAVYAGYFKVSINPTIIRIALWFMFALFLLNTLGNIFSNNQLERMIFTPITLLLSILCLRLAMNK